MPFRLVPRRDRKLNRVVKQGEPRHVKRGEVLFEPGSSPRDVFLVREGHVRLWQPAGLDEVRPRIVEVIGPGELFGIEAVFAGQGVRRRFGAAAGEASTLVILPAAGVATAFRTGTRTFTHAVRALHGDLARARRFGVGHDAPATPQRVAEVLLDLARRFGTERGDGILVGLRLTHQVVADLAGAHRSTVTTLMNDWMYRKLLKDTGEGLLVRPDRLSRLTSRPVGGSGTAGRGRPR